VVNCEEEEEVKKKMISLWKKQGRKQGRAMLTQNPHPAPSTQQAEQASFTHEQIPKRASQFSLKINKRQSS
jgi:hypothetical protein